MTRFFVVSSNFVKPAALYGSLGLALAVAPVAFGGAGISIGTSPAFAHHSGSHAGGEGATNDTGSQQASKGADKFKVAKDDPLHPGNLGRLNGFLHASPSALANASADSAVGILSKTYNEALSSYLGIGDDPTIVVTEDDLATILAEAANKPLSPEQIDAINDKLAAEDPDLAEALDALAEQESDDTPDDTPDDVDTLSETLADLANDIQETEQNQGLGSGDTEDGEDEGDLVDDVGDTVLDTADMVGEAVGDAVDAAGDLIESVF